MTQYSPLNEAKFERILGEIIKSTGMTREQLMERIFDELIRFGSPWDVVSIHSDCEFYFVSSYDHWSCTCCLPFDVNLPLIPIREHLVCSSTSTKAHYSYMFNEATVETIKAMRNI